MSDSLDSMVSDSLDTFEEKVSDSLDTERNWTLERNERKEFGIDLTETGENSGGSGPPHLRDRISVNGNATA